MYEKEFPRGQLLRNCARMAFTLVIVHLFFQHGVTNAEKKHSKTPKTVQPVSVVDQVKHFN